MMHTIQNGKINTVVCIKEQIAAPGSYNGIQLCEKKHGCVAWLNPRLLCKMSIDFQDAKTSCAIV